MAYDAGAESIALIELGNACLRPVTRLSRRRRFVPMAVDVAGDFAATLFLRRGARLDHLEIWILALRGGRWQVLGGGGSTVSRDEDLLAQRPETIPDQLQNPWPALPGIDPARVTGGGATGRVLDSGGGTGMFPWSGRRISYAVVFASARVHHLRVGDRAITVPWHGRTLLTWAARRAPAVSAHDATGRGLGTARLVTRAARAQL